MWQQTLNDFYTIMSTGEPPLGMRFAALNAAAILVYVLYGMSKSKRVKAQTASVFPVILIALNCAIALSAQIMPVIKIAGL